MKCADLPRRLFQVLPTASHRRPRRCHLALEGLETRLLMATGNTLAQLRLQFKVIITSPPMVPIATQARSASHF